MTDDDKKYTAKLGYLLYFCWMMGYLIDRFKKEVENLGSKIVVKVPETAVGMIKIHTIINAHVFKTDLRFTRQTR